MNPPIGMAFDVAQVREAVKAGLSAAIIQELREYGVVFDSRLGTINLLQKDARQYRVRGDGQETPLACDAQPDLVTVSNGGIPAYLTNWVDPTIVKILVSPMRATEIVGDERKQGDWTTTHGTFMAVEQTGYTTAYGDFQNGGMSGINTDFPVRQAFLYQTNTQWGELQLARAGLARIDYANQVNAASILTLNKQQNASYFFGISGIPNYGLLNDPNLYPSIAATAAWNASATTPEQIFEDVRRMFVQVQYQSNGTIRSDSPITLAMSNVLEPALDKTNQFGLSARNQLAKHFPNITVKSAVEYGTAAGELVQMIVNNVEGQQTATTAYTEKMRAHAVITASSSWSQKKSQGTFGTVIYNYTAIASLIGA
jgi:hypothetical protein